jgi:hypothetical protein
MSIYNPSVNNNRDYYTREEAKRKFASIESVNLKVSKVGDSGTIQSVPGTLICDTLETTNEIVMQTSTTADPLVAIGTSNDTTVGLLSTGIYTKYKDASNNIKYPGVIFDTASESINFVNDTSVYNPTSSTTSFTDVKCRNITASGNITGTISTSTSLNAGAITGTSLTASSGGTISTTGAINGGSIAGGTISGTSLTGTSLVLGGGNGIDSSGAIKGSSVTLSSGGSLTIAPNNYGLNASGAITGASLNVNTGAISGGAISGTSLAISSSGTISTGSGAISGGTISGTSLAVSGGGTMSTTGAINGGAITGTSLTASSGGSITTTGAINGGAITGISLSSGSGTINGGAITGTSLSTGSGTISGGGITGTSVTASSGGTISTTGAINGGAITGTSLTASSGGTITTTGAVNGGAFTGTSLSAGSGTISTTGAITGASIAFPNTNTAFSSGVSLLKFYEEFSMTMGFREYTSTSTTYAAVGGYALATINLIRIGTAVFCIIQNCISNPVPMSATPGNAFYSCDQYSTDNTTYTATTSVIPTRFRPASSQDRPARIRLSTGYTTGAFRAGSDGTMLIWASVSGGASTWTANTTNQGLGTIASFQWIAGV